MDEWNNQDRFLNQGNEREKWRRCFSWTSFASNPHLDRATGRLSLLHTAGTIREQFGYRYAETVWRFWSILDVIDGIFTLFLYHFIHRTEEVAGSNPARSTWKPPSVGVFALRCPQSAAFPRWLSSCHVYPTLVQLWCSWGVKQWIQKRWVGKVWRDSTSWLLGNGFWAWLVPFFCRNQKYPPHLETG